MMDKLYEWWEDLSPEEKVLYVCGGFFVVLFIGFVIFG